MLTFHVHLEKRDPASNQCWFYALHAMPTLFGGWTLVREWGQIGSPGRVVVEGFETLEAAQAALATKEREKRKRGYGPPGMGQA